MANFDFMAFGYSAGDADMFVAHAKKYTAQETIDLCQREYSHKFETVSEERRKWFGPQVRIPTLEDVADAWCAFRMGVDSEWPDGCYTLVKEGDAGAFPDGACSRGL